MKKDNRYIVWFNEVDKDDISLVGGKGANLGEMVNLGLPVPNGFIVSSKAYNDFIDVNNLRPKIKEFLSKVDKDAPQSYLEASEKIKSQMIKSSIPKGISTEILKAYVKLSGIFKQALVAVRSSATAEDLPTASFAGQQTTFLNIKGETQVVEKVKDCWASLFEARAIFYREEHKFDHFKVGIAVPIQKMVQSDTSGVMFTCDPVTGQKNQIIIEAIYGLGELIVQGEVIPDYYEVDRNSLKILKKIISKQPIQLIKAGTLNKKSAVPSSKQAKQKIFDRQIVELAKFGKKLHNHYYHPQDIEWSIERNNIYILQTRPVTTLKEEKEEKQKADLKKTIKLGELILEGQKASPGIATGRVLIINSAKEIGKVKKGDVLVTQMTTPDFVPAMKKVVAIVTDKGGQTSHAAIVSRELGLPCVVGTNDATKVLKKEQFITVDGTSGKIYRGGIKTSRKTIREVELRKTGLISKESKLDLIRTATKIYVNLADPTLAEDISKKNVDGVGLLRAEFMIAQIGKHPKKMIKEGKRKEFTDQLAEGIGIFCQKFYPRPVVYRTTDFKTNEYRNLIGGAEFEPNESNPMLGYRGARRYITQSDVFEMELSAIKKVRNKIGLKNLWLMIPFVRTPEELIEVKKIVVSSGLSRSPTFQLWMMVEIPSNVILLEDFIKVGIDGVSIGSNDLTMLILGTDRDNSDVAEVFDERNKAVLWAIEKVIKICQKEKVTSSFCGQAPSQYRDLVESLVEWGITSISVNPDAIDRTREIVYEKERKIWSK